MTEKDKQLKVIQVELKRKSNDIIWSYGVLYSKEKRDWITCKLCKKLIKGGVHRMKHHIVGIVGQVEACPKASDEDKRRVKDFLENIYDKKRANAEELKEERAEVNIDVEDDLTIETNSVPFHAIYNSSFRQFVEAIGQFDPSYKTPSQYLLREPLLKQEVEKTKLSLKIHEEEWLKNGCSIMTDAWTDRYIEESMEAHTRTYIFEYVEKYINKIGPQHVVQVATDNATNNMAATEFLKIVKLKIGLLRVVMKMRSSEVQDLLGRWWQRLQGEDEVLRPRRSEMSITIREIDEDLNTSDEEHEEKC
ncbi:uncharacterized protein LOC124934981 [Impatiens glandulifera]|uniref:uncharacterized protein LOC124934981 n=1 Tax=Impatiens glandulifera TaxID=253017 RepID=UPI001FB08A1E|nr:uncharacterized protein LOC124934981 [Impatiens glandulifera]